MTKTDYERKLCAGKRPCNWTAYVLSDGLLRNVVEEGPAALDPAARGGPGAVLDDRKVVDMICAVLDVCAGGVTRTSVEKKTKLVDV